jgi:hypothetical protein
MTAAMLPSFFSNSSARLNVSIEGMVPQTVATLLFTETPSASVPSCSSF